MGNVTSVKLNEDTKPLELTEKLVRDFQYHIKLVDHSMAAFARTTESLRETFSTVQKRENGENNLNVNDGASGEVLVGQPNYMRALGKIDEALSDQSFVVMDSLSRFLNFIIEIGNKCNVIIPEYALLFVDRYKSESFSDVLEKDMQYHDAILDSMQKMLERANTRYKEAKYNIDNLNEREVLNQKEKVILKDKVNVLEASAAEMKVELEQMRSKEQELEMKNMGMNKEISALECKIENMEHKLSSAKFELETLNKELKSEKDDHLRHVGQLNQEMADLQKILLDKQCENDSLRIDLKNDRQKAKAFQEENSIRVNSLENEKQKLIDESKTYQDEIKRLENLVEQEKDKHTTEGDKILDSINETIIQHGILNEKNNKFFSEEISSVNSKIDEFSQTMMLLNEHVIRMTYELNNAFVTENEQLKTSQQSQAHKLEKKRKTIDHLTQKCQEHEQTIETLNKQLHDAKDNVCELSSKLSAECETRVSLLEEKSSKIEALRDEIAKITEASAGLKKLHENNEEELVKRIEIETTSLQKEVHENNKKVQTLQTHITKITDEKDKLTAETEEKQKMIDSLELKLELTAKKKIYVQVIHPRGFYANDAESDLHGKLKLRFLPESIDLQFLNCSRELITRKGFPSFIICLRNASCKRDADITNVTKSIKETNKETALVFFYNRDKPAFQKEVGKISHGHSKLYGVFDIGFNTDRLHECEENDINIDKLFEFIKDVITKSTKEFESAV